MPKFYYKAKTAQGKIVEGVFEGAAQSQAVDDLINRGYFPLSVTQEQIGDNIVSNISVSGKDLYLFNHQLASLISSGLDLLGALSTIAGQTENKRLAGLVTRIIERIKDGESFSQVLSEYPRVFSRFYVAMIRSAETAGTLEETLRLLADYSGRRQEFISNLRQAMVYPVFIISVGFLTILVMMSFVLPRLAGMLSGMGAELPLPTRILLGLNSFFSQHWLITIIGISFFVVLIISNIHTTKVKKFLERLKYSLPVIKDIVVKIELRDFCNGLSMLLSGGIPLVKALEISRNIASTDRMKDEIKLLRENVDKGKGFSASLKNRKLFPVFMVNITSVAEETGRLDKALLKVSQEYDQDIEKAVKAFSSLLEPVLILAMGLIVGFMVFSILLPVFQMDLMIK
jgi:type IV pilus assembly protein PilC